jgi:hypothetical protein
MPHLLRRHGLILLALLAVTALAFWPGLSGGFLFDDYPNIVQQEKVHAEHITVETMRTAARAFPHGLAGRPLATITFAIDHAFGGLDPWGYKFTGLLVHLVNALLVYLLVGRLLPLAGASARAGRGAAFAIALLWAIHPLQVSTVLYVVQRMETLSLSFVLMALLCYLRGRENQISGTRAWPWLLACLPLVALGLLSKETAALFAAYTLALELTVLGFRSSSASVARAWRLAYITGVALAVLVFLVAVLPQYSPPEVYAVRNFTLAERLLTQLRVLPMYLGWILVPQPASYLFYYDNFPHSQGLLQPVSTLAGGVFLAGLAAAGLALRRKMPLLSLGILWFFAAHLITSNVVPLELVFEHRNYFAILGVLLAIADMYLRLPSDDDSRLRVLIVALVLGGALALTLIRSAGWGNSLMLALELAAKNPDSPRASVDLGEQYMLRAGTDPTSEFYAMAEAEFERGSAVPNASPMPEQGLIVLAATAGRPAKPEWWDRVVEKLETRAIGPQEVAMITGMLEMRENGMPIDDARFADAYLVLARRTQMPPSQYYVFGDHALRHLQDEALAMQLFKRAVERSSDNPEFVAAMVDALDKAGHRDLAERVAAHARALGIADIQLAAPADAKAVPVGEPSP